MKKNLLAFLLLLCAAKMYSQQNDSIYQSNLVFSGKTIPSIKVSLKNADEEYKPVNVKFNFNDSIFKSSGLDSKKMNLMMWKAYYTSMYSCKNKYTFSCKEITFFYNTKKDLWIVFTDFTAQNGYGGSTQETGQIYFEPDGSKQLTDSEMMARNKKQ